MTCALRKGRDLLCALSDCEFDFTCKPKRCRFDIHRVTVPPCRIVDFDHGDGLLHVSTRF